MRRFVVSLTCLALVCVAAAAPASAARPLQTAFYFDPGVGPAADITVQRARMAGATAIRLSLAWQTVAPRERPERFDAADPGDPAYRWLDFDRRVAAAVNGGLEPYVTILKPPGWARNGGADGLPGQDVNLAEMRRFVHAAALRYSGSFAALPRVRYWMAWNEPNLRIYLQPQYIGEDAVSPELYRRLVNEFADAVYEVNPDNRVVAGGLLPFTSTQGVAPLRFMREMLCMSTGARPQPTCEARVKFDIWAHNPYTSGGPTHHATLPDDVSIGDLPEMRALLTAAVRAGHVESKEPVRFWASEFSWDSRPPDPNRTAVPLHVHTRWVAEALYRMWQAGVELVTWLQLRDDPYPASPYQSGLYFRGATLQDDRPKPSLTSFRFPFVAFRARGRISVWGRTPAGTPGRVIVEETVGGAWKRLATLRADRYGIFSARLKPAPKPRARPSRTPPRASYRRAVLTDSPVAYWRLGETSGRTAKDEKGTRSGAYLGGTRLGVPGALRNDRNRAAAFNGVDARVALGTVVSPKTVELWIKTTTTDERAAFSNRNEASHYVFLGVGGSAYAGKAEVFDGDQAFSEKWINDDKWHHVVYTYEGNTRRIYVDGELDAVRSSERLEGGDPASLAYDVATHTHFKGALDEVAIYDRALSAAAVKRHFVASGRRSAPAQPGYVRARLADGTAKAQPFSLAPQPDFYVLPFGEPRG